MKGILVHLATLQASQRDSTADDARVLKKAAAILRQTPLGFLKSKNVGFKGTVFNRWWRRSSFTQYIYEVGTRWTENFWMMLLTQMWVDHQNSVMYKNEIRSASNVWRSLMKVLNYETQIQQNIV